MSKISTGTGDRGTTGLADGSRIEKNDPRVQALGSLDEANEMIGIAIAFLEEDGDLRALLLGIQCDLFEIGAEVAQAKGSHGPDAERVRTIEAATDQFEDSLPVLTKFILPGGSKPAAFLHASRGAVRRAERTLWQSRPHTHVSDMSLTYLNRLSDLLFLAARAAKHRRTVADPEWNSKSRTR
ncbi:MAG: cob(I)yrinic acid a,c-diamide adenosyltransferase [Thermoplasmatota archaeon]